VIVSTVTVYGARSVTLSGSGVDHPVDFRPARLRQALLGKVMTVGRCRVAAAPRFWAPETSTSAASRALASAVGISWDLRAADRHRCGTPRDRSACNRTRWSAGVSGVPSSTRPGPGPASTKPIGVSNPKIGVADLKGSQVQAGKLTEWLKARTRRAASAEDLWAPKPIWGIGCRGPAASARTDDGGARVRPGAGWWSWTARKVGALAAEDPAQDRGLGSGRRSETAAACLLITISTRCCRNLGGRWPRCSSPSCAPRWQTDGSGVVVTSARPDQA